LVLQAHIVAFLCFVAITYFFEDYRYSRIVVFYFSALGAFASMSFRFVVRSGLRAVRRRGHNLRHVLAVGEGPSLEALMERIAKYPEVGLRVTGVLTQRPSSATEVGGRPVLGHYEDVERILASTQVDEVLISAPSSQSEAVDRMLDTLKDYPLAVRLVPDVRRIATLGCEVEMIDGLPVMRLNDSPMIGWGGALKRATDVVISFVALVMLMPVLVGIAIAVRLSSKGPILYSQERMGLDGRSFRMLKFRSMKVDAESSTGAVWCQSADDRRTAVGTLLRKTSLDELPQFWNVFCGDMSLVGPRPERPVFVDQFRQEIPNYMLRHKVKSGITGWAQVNGWRGNTSLVRRIECDIFYIKNWSFALDFKILFLTLYKGFIHKNAY
jgi:Undecaprenyl-phosphate glucose phosphotransferase